MAQNPPLQHQRLVMVLIFLMVVTLGAFAQPDINWTTPVGSDEQDYVRDIVAVGDGYVFPGEYITGSPPYLCKVNYSGEEVWRVDLTTIPSTGAEYIGHSLSGQLIVTRRGTVGNTVENQLAWYDQDGNYLFHVYAGDIDTHIEHKPLFFFNNDMLIAGITDGNLFCARFNMDGELIWHRDFNQVGMPEAIRMQQDGSFIVLARGHAVPMVMMHVSIEGDVIRSRGYDPGPQNYPCSFAPVDGGGWMILLNKYAAYLHRGLEVMRLNADLEVLWQRELVPMEDAYAAFGMEVMPNGQFLIHGDRYVNSQYDLVPLRIDEDANIVWSEIVGGPAHDRGRAAIIHSSSEILLFGTTGSYGAGENDAWLVQYTPDVTGSFKLTLSPHQPPVVIPPGGGLFHIFAQLGNSSTAPWTVDVRLHAITPDEQLLPLLGPWEDVLFNGGAGHVISSFPVSIPGAAPLGVYTIEAEVLYEDEMLLHESFEVVKE